jgi:membrane protease subunit (stomatin/prohibitin family)
VQEYLRQMIVGRLGTALATAQVPMLDLAAHQDRIGVQLAGVLSEDLSDVGIHVAKFIIENISVPPEVEAALDKRTQMGIVGNLDQYTKFQTANAIEDAANNPGGGASEGIGLGVGLAVGQQVAGSLARGPGQPPAGAGPGAPAGPPPLPPQEQWYAGIAGQQQGPFDRAGLAAQVRGGAITPTTLVWKQGLPQWVPAQQVPEVAEILGSVPPPLPPQS